MEERHGVQLINLEVNMAKIEQMESMLTYQAILRFKESILLILATTTSNLRKYTVDSSMVKRSMLLLIILVVHLIYMDNMKKINIIFWRLVIMMVVFHT